MKKENLTELFDEYKKIEEQVSYPKADESICAKFADKKMRLEDRFREISGKVNTDPTQHKIFYKIFKRLLHTGKNTEFMQPQFTKKGANDIIRVDTGYEVVELKTERNNTQDKFVWIDPDGKFQTEIDENLWDTAAHYHDISTVRDEYKMKIAVKNTLIKTALKINDEIGL